MGANFSVNCAGLMALMKANGANTTALQCAIPVNAMLPAPLNASLPFTLGSILLCPVSCGSCGAACSDLYVAVLAAANTTCVALKSKCNASLSTIIPTVPSKIHVKHACMKECSYCTTTATPTASPTPSPTASPTKASSSTSASSATSAPTAASPAPNTSSPATNATSAPTAAPTKTSSAYSVSVFSIGLLSSMVINLL